MSRVVVLCVEGLNSELLNIWLDRLPTFRLLAENSIRGQVGSVPPLSFPNCWLNVLCGHNPTPVHSWDFHYRDDSSYNDGRSYTTDLRRLNTLYNTLSKRAQRVGLVNMPGTDESFEVPGGLVASSGASLRQGVDTEATAAVQRIDTDSFDSVSTFYHRKKCDFVTAFITGYAHLLDSFYRFEGTKGAADSGRHSEDTHGYYRFLDSKIGEFLNELDEDTAVCVLSAYGLTRLKARVNINELLIKKGYLRLRKPPGSPSDFASLAVDWNKTRCWSTGFNGSIHMNLRGRESQGTVDPMEYDGTLDQLAKLMGNVAVAGGSAVHPRVWIRNDLYCDLDAATGPDLFVGFGDFASSELVGHEAGAVLSHDLAPEGFNAAANTAGCFFLHGAAGFAAGELDAVAPEDFAPTIFELLGILHSDYMRGRSLLSRLRPDRSQSKPVDTTVFHSRLDTLAKDESGHGSPRENEERIRSRLDALGY